MASAYYLMRCVSCNRLVTKRSVVQGGCSCGSKKIKATNPIGLGEKMKVRIFPRRYGVEVY